MELLTKEIVQPGSGRVTLLHYPTDEDWKEVFRRALVTVGKGTIHVPSDKWKRSILEARHSPIRYLQFSFLLENIPSWVSVHLVRHIHAQPYVRSQRNDRQTQYDRNTAPQNAPVSMIWDMNGEELLTIANKRLCYTASPETQLTVATMCCLVNRVCPEYKEHLVPMCKYHGGVCHELTGCPRSLTREVWLHVALNDKYTQEV